MWTVRVLTFLTFVAACNARWVIQNANGDDMLEVVAQPNGVKLFDDSGSGADQDLGMWEPSDMPGYWRLGHCAVASKTGGPMPCSLPMVMDISGLGPLDPLRPIAAPGSINPNAIWTDRGSGSDTDYGFWSMSCPAGFVPLSDLGAVGYNVPSFLTTQVRCVNALLVHQCSIGDMIWSDRGSGADNDGSVWRLTNGQNSDKFDQHFRGASNHNPPTTNPWCLKQIVELPDV